MAAVKAKIDASQTARREIDKELAAVQGRLSKYKGQLMEVKTNKEYQAMQHEIAAAEQGVREHEDRLLDRMEEAETLAAELKAVGCRAQIGAGGGREREEVDRGRARRARAKAGATDLRPRCPRRSDLPARDRAVRATRETPQGSRALRGAGRRLHAVPRPPASTGLQRGPPERRADSVRQLLADSLLRSGRRGNSHPAPIQLTLVTSSGFETSNSA